VLLAVFGPIVAPHSPDWQASKLDNVPHPPSGQFWLGTDVQQHDLFSQLLAGGRDTLLIAFVAGIVATVLSVLVGVMPDGDTGNPLLIGAVIALSAWAWGARVLRAQTLALRNQDYVESARVVGEGRARIILFEILPNLLPILASSFIFTVIYGIGAYASLAWLGLINPTNASWGTMLNTAQQFSATTSGTWWWYGPPALCIAFVGIALALLNFGIDEIVNPRMRSTRRGLRSRGPRFQLGLTPVVRAEEGTRP
jgi:peptide/nickel transport system permease protein